MFLHARVRSDYLMIGQGRKYNKDLGKLSMSKLASFDIFLRRAEKEKTRWHPSGFFYSGGTYDIRT